jgi:hypothetical protein
MNAQPRNLKAIRAAVLQAVATGYLLGQNAAQAYYAKAKTGRKLVKAAPTAEDIDSWLDADFWDNWTAGNKPAALLVKPPGALSDLLDKAGATINGLNRTTMNRLGTILGDGLERGLSGKSIADAIESLLDDPSRALTIANTEMARAMSTASMDTYNGFGVEMVEWLHADFCTCELCTEAEAMGPQPIGFDWSMGDGVTEPPMHPNCICAIAPVIDEGDGSGLDLFDFGDVLEMSATINKYDPDQPRDELGRFGSGGGDSGPKPLNLNDTEKVADTLNFQREQGFTAENNSPVWDMTVTSYTDGSGQYNNINGYLREGEFYAEAAGLSPSEVMKTEGDIANLTAIIDAAPPLTEDLVTFRGITGEDVVYEFSNLEVGDQYTEAGFISTSLDKEVANRFTGGSNVNEDRMMLQIISPAGTQGLMPESYQRQVAAGTTGEKEWLIQRGTTFDVIAVSDNLITVQVNNEVPRVF